MLELLSVLKETENDDITCVLQKIIAIYYDKLAPIMYEICQNLVSIVFNLSMLICNSSILNYIFSLTKTSFGRTLLYVGSWKDMI